MMEVPNYSSHDRNGQHFCYCAASPHLFYPGITPSRNATTPAIHRTCCKVHSVVEDQRTKLCEYMVYAYYDRGK